MKQGVGASSENLLGFRHKVSGRTKLAVVATEMISSAMQKVSHFGGDNSQDVEYRIVPPVVYSDRCQLQKFPPLSNGLTRWAKQFQKLIRSENVQFNVSCRSEIWRN